MTVRVFIGFVTFFVTCRLHALLHCLRWRERPPYLPQFRRARVRHWDTREIRPLWTRKVKESAGREFRKERLPPKAERPRHGRSGS